MVNTGKPSTGCYTCRARRIKCDEAKPECMRCQKLKKKCPGYRDLFELKLGFQRACSKRKGAPVLSRLYSNVNVDSNGEPLNNLETLRRMNSVYGVEHPWMYQYSGSSSDDSEEQSLIISPNSYSSPPWYQQTSIPAQLSTSIKQHATCYFFSNFVLTPQQDTTWGYLDFLVPLLPKATPGSPLALAFSACALVALGSRPNSKSLLPEAEVTYVEALKRINLALKNDQEALDDSTLAAISLLSVFEQLSPSHMNIGGFGSHIRGAMALIKSRGEGQFDTTVGRHLGLNIRAHMLISCTAMSKPMEGPPELWMGLEAYDDMTQILDGLNFQLGTLRVECDVVASLIDRTVENTQRVARLLQNAEFLDHKFIEWQRTLPASWEYKPICWIDKVDDVELSYAHPGRVDTYPDLAKAEAHNLCRTARIYTWVTILRCVAWLGGRQDYRLSTEYKVGSHQCKTLIADIVASVPYFLTRDRLSDPSYLAQKTFNDSPKLINDPNVSKSIRGRSISCVTWPLFAAWNSDFSSDSQRRFLNARLNYMAEVMGFHQAGLARNAGSRRRIPTVLIDRDRDNPGLPIVNGVPARV